MHRCRNCFHPHAMTYCFIATLLPFSTCSRIHTSICTTRKKIVKGNLVSIFGVLTFSQFQSKFKISPSGMQEAEAMEDPKWYVNNRWVCYFLQTCFCIRHMRTFAFQVARDSFSRATTRISSKSSLLASTSFTYDYVPCAWKWSAMNRVPVTKVQPLAASEGKKKLYSKSLIKKTKAALPKQLAQSIPRKDITKSNVQVSKSGLHMIKLLSWKLYVAGLLFF